MGRIEEALAKLQARHKTPSNVTAAPQPLGRVLQPGQAGGERQSVRELPYGGRRIVVDIDMLHAQRLLAPDDQEKKLADEYRAIKRPLLKNADVDQEPLVPRGNLWMVASAVAGEGKTFTSLNLSLSVAREQDWSVVLVDGDCNKSHLTRLFGAEEEPGLMDLLRDRTLQFDALVMPTNIPGLSILPAGRYDENAAEFLSGARMNTICEELAADPGRIVMFDSPPLLQTAEAPALAAQVGQIVLVVLANRTPQEVVLAAIERLDPTKAISLILNQADGRENVTAYGYGYDYAAGLDDRRVEQQ